jgi:hypothetical protein
MNLFVARNIGQSYYFPIKQIFIFGINKIGEEQIIDNRKVDVAIFRSERRLNKIIFFRRVFHLLIPQIDLLQNSILLNHYIIKIEIIH